MCEADKVRETYRDDPTVTNEEYGRMVEDADRADETREWEGEREPADPAEHTWTNEHAPGCPVTHWRAELLKDLRAEPTSPYLLGAVPEYDGGGDQEAELCTCPPRGWIVYEREPLDAGERIVGYTVSPFASVFEWARDVDADPADLRVELAKPATAPAAPASDEPADVIIAKLTASAESTRANCLAYVTRRWSGGIETDPFPSLDVLWAIYEAHESELWEAAGSDEHEAWDADMAAASAYEEAVKLIRAAYPEDDAKGVSDDDH